MKNSENLQMSGGMLGGVVRCAQNSPDCDLMAWAIANQDLARAIKTPDAPEVISLHAKGDEIAEVCDNMSKICNTVKKICYNCNENRR